MNNKWILLILVLVLSSCLISSGSVLAGEPVVGEDDDYIKDVEINKQGEFYWTLYKNSSKNYAVSVEATGLQGWSHSISPSSFVLSEDEQYKIVTLEFRVPKYPDNEKKSSTVKFVFRELNGTEKVTIEKNIFVNVFGIYEGRENTVLGGFNNPLPYPLNNPYGALILNIAIWLIIAFIVYLIIKYVLFAIAKKTKTKFDDAVVELVKKPVLLLVVLYGLIVSIIRFGINIGYQASLFQIYYIVVVIVSIYIVYRVFNELLDEITIKKGGEKTNFDTVLKPVLKKVGIVVIVVGGLIFGLNAIGIEITALLAGAGVMGLVLAFAAQDTLSNYFSGMHLLLDRPFRIGDIIILESGEYCRVESVGMRSTKLYSLFEHELIVLPNNTVANQKIVNIVQPDTKIRNKIEVSVAYGSDIDKVKKILHEVTMNHPDTIHDEGFEPLVRFTEFGDSGLKFIIIFWVNEVMNQWKAMSDIRSEIDARFRKEDITVPFPQRTVWIKEHQQNKKSDNKKE